MSMKINFGIETAEGFLPMNDQYPVIMRWLNKRYNSNRHLPKDGTPLTKQGLRIVKRRSNDTEINIFFEPIQ